MVQGVVPVFLKVRDTRTRPPVRIDAGTDWEMKEELSAAAADRPASSATAASPAATTLRALTVRHIEDLSPTASKIRRPTGLSEDEQGHPFAGIVQPASSASAAARSMSSGRAPLHFR